MTPEQKIALLAINGCELYDMKANGWGIISPFVDGGARYRASSTALPALNTKWWISHTTIDMFFLLMDAPTDWYELPITVAAQMPTDILYQLIGRSDDAQ